MRFRNYCVVIMGVIDSATVKLEIQKVSESKTNILDAKGILIGTFTSALSPKELSDWFKLNERNFLVFDLDTECSGVNITKEGLHKDLFGFIDKMTNDDLTKKTNDFLKDVELSSTTSYTSYSDYNRTSTTVRKLVKPKKITQDDVDNMTQTEKEALQDKIIDANKENGMENMSEYDKEILSFLWK